MEDLRLPNPTESPKSSKGYNQSSSLDSLCPVVVVCEDPG